MDSEEECAAIISKRTKKRKQRRHRSIWVKPWLSRRSELGVYNTLLQELRFEEINDYKKFLRISPENFDEILCLLEADIQKQTTRFFIFIIRTKFIRTQAFGHPEIKNMIITQGFPQQ